MGSLRVHQLPPLVQMTCRLGCFCHFNFPVHHTAVTSFYFPREGSLVSHFWLILSVPKSRVEKVTLEHVSGRMFGSLLAYSKGDRANIQGYLVYLPTFSITGKKPCNHCHLTKPHTSQMTPLLFIIIYFASFSH